MNRFVKCFVGDKSYGVAIFVFALAISFTSTAFAETQETMRSQAMSFAKKKAASEIVESTPAVVADSVTVSAPVSVTAQAVESVPAVKPVFMPPVPTVSSSMPAKAASTRTAVAAAPAAASTAVATEAQSKLQAIKTQEQWVGKLTKQLEGETKQLKEMRESYAQAFGKEPK